MNRHAGHKPEQLGLRQFSDELQTGETVSYWASRALGYAALGGGLLCGFVAVFL